MDEPLEMTARRWRSNLMAAVRAIAATGDIIDLHDTELIEAFYDCVCDSGLAKGDAAMTPEERVVVLELCSALNRICDEAREIKRRGRLGRAVHGLEPRDLISLGWFEQVQPLARTAFNTLLVQGWLDDDLSRPD